MVSRVFLHFKNPPNFALSENSGNLCGKSIMNHQIMWNVPSYWASISTRGITCVTVLLSQLSQFLPISVGGPMAGIPCLIASVRCVALKILWKSWCTPWSMAWNGCDKCRWPFFSGWCFGTFWLFHSVGNVIIPTDELMFFRGVETTNQ